LNDPLPGAGRKGPHPQLTTHTHTHKAHVQHGLDKRRLRHGHSHPLLSDTPSRLCKVGASKPEQGLHGGTKVEVDCLPSIPRSGKSALTQQQPLSHGGGRSGSSGMVLRFHGPRCTTVPRHPCHHVSDMMAASQQHWLDQAVLRRRQQPRASKRRLRLRLSCPFTPRRREVFPTSSGRLRLASEPPACLTVSGGPRSSRLVRRRSRGMDHDS
jgi:hypothetical protein